MRYFIAGLLLLAFTATLCALSLSFLTGTLTEALSLLEQASDTLAEDPDAAFALTAHAHRRWEAHCDLFALLLAHDDLRELDRGFANTLRALERRQESSADQLADLCSLLSGLLRREQLTVENVF